MSVEEHFEREVPVGCAFTINLGANPTTGYRWYVDFDEGFLRLKETVFKPYSRTIGGGGAESFAFLPITVGESTIIFRYKRGWESEPIKVKHYRIVIGEKT